MQSARAFDAVFDRRFHTLEVTNITRQRNGGATILGDFGDDFVSFFSVVVVYDDAFRAMFSHLQCCLAANALARACN